MLKNVNVYAGPDGFTAPAPPGRVSSPYRYSYFSSQSLLNPLERWRTSKRATVAHGRMRSSGDAQSITMLTTIIL